METRHHTLSTDLTIAGGAFAGGLILGAGMMAIFDPQMGRTRRSFAGQKARRMMRLTGQTLEGQRKHLINRSRGIVASTRSRMEGEEIPSDMTLINRVRSTMGRISSHPHALDVQACSGRVIVWGPIIESEADPLINTIASLPGVISVEDQLQRHTDPRGVPALQGGRTRPDMSRRRSGMLGGMGLLGLAGTVAAGIYAARRLDVDFDELTDRFLGLFQRDEFEEDFDEDLDQVGRLNEVDQMERTGTVPDWVEVREEHILIDRRR